MGERERHQQVRSWRRLPAPIEPPAARRSGESATSTCGGLPCRRRAAASRSALVLPVSATWTTVQPGGHCSICQMLPEAVMTPTLAAVLQKILIANRGEIAVRVIRAARELGIATVAVYSELDRDALHVRLADEAYALGGQTAAESYLNTEAILDAIERERRRRRPPRLRLLQRERRLRPRRSPSMGVAFIGPPPAAIDEMGDKVSSRKAALRGGAPIVPGTTEFAQSARRDPRLRRGARLAGRHQGRVRRRRPRHEGRAVGRPRSTTRWTSAQREAKASSAATRSTSSATSRGRATSRCRSSATSTATSCGSRPATARRSAATRS